MSLMSLAGSATAGYLLTKLWKRKVGDARVVVRPELARQARLFVNAEDTRGVLSCRLTMKNLGNQQALVIDAHTHLQPSGDHYSELRPVCRLLNLDAPRADGYWEAFIISIGKEIEVEIRTEVTSPEGGLTAKLAAMGAARFDFHYKYYCRTPMHYCKVEVVLPIDSFERLEQEMEWPAPPPSKPKAPIDLEAPVVPLRTHLLRPGESVVEIVQRYAGEVGKPGDIVALAETAVAIMQNRMSYCEDIRPRFLARQLNFLFGMHSSLSSPYSMEMAIREVGLSRILLATAAGVLGKITRREGDFYRLAGRGVAAIDDCTGTLPPFDKHVVMGPAQGDQLVAEIKAKTGMDAVIVDANDLGKVDIFHTSDASRNQEVVDALKPNPQGNAAEMTPLVLIRKR
jgi:hypothetical protein